MTIEGSRFEVLSQEQDNVVERDDGSLNAGILEREVADVVMDSREVTKVNGAGSSTERTVVSVEPVVGKSDSMGVRTVALPTVAARGKVVAADSTLPVGRHSAVRVVIDDGRAPKSTKERILPASFRGSQDVLGPKCVWGCKVGHVRLIRRGRGIRELLILRSRIT
ncbi:hypothetical protein V6N11_050442 [Hibiscus sabdariffa]